MLVGMWLMCFLLLLSCIVYWEHRKWVFSIFLFLGPCVCSVPGHQVRPILLDRTPGAISVDGPHPDQDLWEQTHHSWQRHQHVTFASCVFFWADRHWVSEKWHCYLWRLGQNLHCWCQRRGRGICLQCGLRLKAGLPFQIQFFTLPWKCLLFSLNLFVRFNFSSNIGSFVQDRQKGWRSKIRLLSFELLLASGIVLKPTRRTSEKALSSSWIFLLETQGGKVVGWGSCLDGWSLQSWDLVD